MRITQHNRQQQKLTDELQEKLTKAVQKELSWLWRWVVRFLHKAKLNKAEVVPLEGAALWDEFQKRMHESLIKVIYSVDSLAIIERNLDFLISRGIDLNDFSTIDVMDGFIDTIADRVTLITVSTKKKIANRLARWYKTPGDSMQDVINDLKDTFGVTRAELIAQTEITEMDSKITDNMMQVLGDDVWWWETMRDQLVCVSRLVGPDGKIYRGCRELHGKRFQRGMNMPPKGSHPGCRCKAKIVHGVRLENVGQMPLRLSKVDWVEQEHPRAEDGKFGTKSGNISHEEYRNSLPDKVKKFFASNSSDATNKTFAERFAVNRLLRTGKQEENPYDLDIDGTMKALDLATTEHAYTLSEPLTAYRGITKKAFAKTKGKYIDKGFAFFTTDKEMARKYAGKRGEVMSVELPVGTKCALGFEDQHELILPKNSVFEFTKDDEGKIVGRLK